MYMLLCMMICLAVLVQAAPCDSYEALAPRSAFTPQPDTKEETTDQDVKDFIVMKLISSYKNGYSISRVRQELERLTAGLGEGVSTVFFSGTDDVCYFSVKAHGEPAFFSYGLRLEPREFASFEEMLAGMLKERPPPGLAPVLDGFMAGEKQLLRSISTNIFPDFPEPPFNKGEYADILNGIETALDRSSPDAVERFKKLVDQLERVAENIRRRASFVEFPESVKAKIILRLGGLRRELRVFQEQKAALFSIGKQYPEIRGPFLTQLNQIIRDGGVHAPYAQSVKSADLARLAESFRDETLPLDKRILLLRDMAAWHPGETVTAEMINSALNSSNKALIDEGIASAVKTRDGRVSEALRGLMASQDLDIKLKAIEAVGYAGTGQHLEYLAHYLDHIKPDVRKAARLAAEKMAARTTSVEALQSCRNKLKTCKVGPEEFSGLVDLYASVSERILELDPQKGRGGAKIVQVHTFGTELPNYYEMVAFSGGIAPVSELYVVHAAGTRTSISKRFTSDTFNPIADIEIHALVRRVLVQGFKDQAESVVGWRAEAPGEIALFSGRDDFREALKAESLKNPFIAFLFERAVAAERTKKQPSFTSIDGLLKHVTADVPAMREIVTDAGDSRLETRAVHVLAGYVPNTRTILPAIFKGIPQVLAAARQSTGFQTAFRDLAVPYKIDLEGAHFKPQIFQVASLARRLIEAYPQLNENQLLKRCGECFKNPDVLPFLDLLRFFGFRTDEECNNLRAELVGADTLYQRDPRTAYQRGVLRLMLQLATAKEIVRGEIVRRAAAHEMAHLIYTSLLDPRDKKMFIDHARKRLEADPAVQQYCVETGFREVTHDAALTGVYGADVEMFAVLLENMAYRPGDNAPASVLRPRVEDLSVLDQIGLVPRWFEVPLTAATTETITPAHPARKVYEDVLRSAGIDPAVAALRSPIFFTVAKQTPDESVENLVFRDEDLKHFNIDAAAIATERKGTVVVRSVPSPKGGSLLLLKGADAGIPVKMFYLASPNDRYYLRSVAAVYAIDKDFRGLTKIFLFRKPALPVKVAESMVHPEEIYRIVFKETTDVDAAMKDMLRDKVRELFIPDPALGYSTALASLIDKTAQVVKNTDAGLTREALDEEFMERHNLQKIERSFKLGSYLYSPNVYQQQVAYFLLLYERYRRLTAKGPGQPAALEEKMKEFVRTVRNSLPLVELIGWHSEYLLRQAQRAGRSPAPAVDQMPLMLPSALKESTLLNDAVYAVRPVEASS
jgi:hypothetical protein